MGKTVTSVILISVLLIFSGCGKEEPAMSFRAVGPEEPDQVLTETRMVLSERDHTSAVIDANTVKIYEARDYASLEDSVVIFFYNNKGEHTTTLTAMKGEIWGVYDNADSLKATGDVVIRSEENNAFMEAPAIRWVAADSLVYGEGLVRLNSENGYEEGTGFEAKDDLSEYRFRGPVSGEVHGDDVEIIDR